MIPPRQWSLARWAILVTSLVVVLMFPVFVGLAFLQFGPVPYFLAVIVILLGISVWTGNRWVWLANALVLLLFAGLNAPFILPELTRPDHYPDYVLSIIAMIALPIAIVAGIAVVMEGRKGAAPSAVRMGSWGAILALIVVGMLAGASAASFSLRSAPSGGAGTVLLTPDATVAVTTKGDTFDPTTVTIPSGKVVKVSVANADSGLHRFNVDDLNINAELPAGKTTDLWLKLDKAGSYQLYCVIHSTKGADGKWTGMVGTLTVT